MGREIEIERKRGGGGGEKSHFEAILHVVHYMYSTQCCHQYVVVQIEPQKQFLEFPDAFGQSTCQEIPVPAYRHPRCLGL